MLPDIAYLNDEGSFTRVDNPLGIDTSHGGNGGAWADIDNHGDGDLDWFVTTIANRFEAPRTEKNQLYINQGGRLFQNESVEAGVGENGWGWGWGTNFFDYDNDRDLDIVMVNNNDNLVPEGGSLRQLIDAPMTLWKNDGTARFEDVSKTERVDHIGWGVGVVNFDYDQDGDLDIFAVHQFSRPVLLRVSLKGTLSNPDAIGAFLTLQLSEDGPTLVSEYNPSNAYMAQLEPFVHFGLGEHDGLIHKLTVRWPSSIAQEFTNTDPEQVFQVVEDASLFVDTTAPTFSTHPLTQVVRPGEDLELQVAFEGHGTPTITWFRNGEIIPGESLSTLSFDATQPSNAGVYHAVAVNSAGSTQSETATVAVRSRLSR